MKLTTNSKFIDFKNRGRCWALRCRSSVPDGTERTRKVHGGGICALSIFMGEKSGRVTKPKSAPANRISQIRPLASQNFDYCQTFEVNTSDEPISYIKVTMDALGVLLRPYKGHQHCTPSTKIKWHAENYLRRYLPNKDYTSNLTNILTKLPYIRIHLSSLFHEGAANEKIAFMSKLSIDYQLMFQFVVHTIYWQKWWQITIALT